MDLYLATILEMAINYDTDGLMSCDGRILQVQQWAALYSLLGNSFGGDGINNFAIPDLRPTDANGNKRPWQRGEIRKMIVVNGLYPVHE